MTPADETWKSYRREQIWLYLQWSVIGFCVIVPAWIAIIAIGGDRGFLDAGLFGLAMGVVTYLFYLRDSHILSQKFYGSNAHK